jgi:hypothetical protein
MINATEDVIAAPADPEFGERCRHPRRTMIKNDRRASQRFKAKPGSIVSYVEGAGAIRDLSMGGVFLLDSEPLPVGTKITFSLMLGSETASFQGIVRRSVAEEGMGIQFTEMPREVRRRLLSYFASLP